MHIKQGCIVSAFMGLFLGIIIGVFLMQIPNLSFVAQLSGGGEICDNCIDDDGDLDIDCDDSDCIGDPACSSSS